MARYTLTPKLVGNGAVCGLSWRYCHGTPHVVDSVTPTIPSEGVFACVVWNPSMWFDPNREALLLPQAIEQQDARSDLDRVPGGRANVREVNTIVVPNIRHGSLHFDGAVEAGDLQGRVVQYVSWDSLPRALVPLVRVLYPDSTKVHDVVFVRGIVDEARVRCLLRREMARSKCKGSLLLTRCIGYRQTHVVYWICCMKNQKI